ncbi:hypothetical protein EJ05DRAFT_539429 [Pseudovirgaria hyperparasitica]|uniref:TPR-like protein n=1 Tax=Pseudovirgaria hyperparasitica TaxID=470096 RepID=A0A6A6W5Y7_9PEZI|nr:uncharacterized protein EJ05DRAFT_539429 [Pseudovirgaria hyperparasitica]KAF2756471.1 hypothetical protein EJ05DRAFT_539429 [Pseudovirgaria hyperparasitica]
MVKRKNLKSLPKNVPKSFSKRAKEPEDENDFLETADDFEKTGGKWRAGDTAKSARNYKRAIEVYNEGLARFPKSFDLAYNKSRLLYDLADDARMSHHFDESSNIALLRGALVSHRYALSLDNENTDVLFNTGQVLTTLSEALYDDDDENRENKSEQIKLLDEAVQLFSDCLRRQEQDYEQTQSYMQESDDQTQANDTGNDNPDVSMSDQTDDPSDSTSGDWVNIVEPTKASDIIDTSLAILTALSALAALHHGAASALEAIVNISTPLIHDTIPKALTLIPTSLPGPPETTGPSLSLTATGASFKPTSTTALNPRQDATSESDLAIAQFITSLSTAQFTTGILSPSTYADTIATSFTPVYGAQSVLPTSILAYADALTTIAQTLSTAPSYPSAALVSTRWTALKDARSALLGARVALSNSTSSSEESRIAVLTGLADVCMLRGAMLRDIEPQSPERSLLTADTEAAGSDAQAGIVDVQTAQATLQTRCAGVYYRDAGRVAERCGKEYADEAMELRVKSVAAAIMAVGEVEGTAWEELRSLDIDVVQTVLKDMVDDGLVDTAFAKLASERRYAMSVDAE